MVAGLVALKYWIGRIFRVGSVQVLYKQNFNISECLRISSVESYDLGVLKFCIICILEWGNLTIASVELYD